MKPIQSTVHDSTPHESVHLLPARFAELSRGLHAAIMPIVRDPEVADDLVQDVWVRFMERRPDEADDANIPAWLATVGRRLALNYLASGRVRFRAAVTTDQFDPPSHDPSPADAAGQSQQRGHILDALSGLSRRHKTVIQLCDVEGYSYAQAGARLGISGSAVTSLLHRARKAFRRSYLLAVAPPWLRAIAQAGPADELLEQIDTFSPPTDLSEAVEWADRDLFGHLAGHWDRIRSETVPDELEAALTLRADPAPDDSALDVGTGTGIVAVHVAPHVRRVIGIDKSLPMLKVANERAARSGSGNVLMEFGDLLRLPIDHASIDVAFCSLVLRFMHRPEDAVRSMSATLRPGGRLVVCDVQRPPQGQGTGVGREQLRAWLGNAGLERIHVDRVGQSRDPGFLVAVAHRP